MDASMTARDAAENISEGINCLHEIALHADTSHAACLSQMRDAFWLIRSGIKPWTGVADVDETMIARLDAIILLLGGIDDGAQPSAATARDEARAYIAYIESKWGKFGGI